jgi:hypothetical protein
MSEYLEIIQSAIQNAYTSQDTSEPINEDTTLKLIATVDVAMEYLSDHCNKGFHEVVNLIRDEARNNEDIIRMLMGLKELIDRKKGEI